MDLKKKILVVEDSKMNRMLLNGILSEDYMVLEAENGAEALEVLKKYGQDISLILLDIIMPVMDGYTFLSIIKAHASFSTIPVIVTTQSDGELDEVNALSRGATDFVVKPYKPQVILHRVASIINLRETAAIINLMQYDRLTGLYSKEFFYQKAKEILQQNPEKQYDIVCSDIENFKLVNDVFGTPAGDRLLCDIADMYTQYVGVRGICSRFNADQFAWLVEHSEEYTSELFTRMNEEINTFPNAKSVVVKWGVYPIGERNLTVDQMCDRALLAARGIKGQYGKNFARYDDALRSRLLWEQNITASMEASLQAKQFEIYLQPKYNLQNDSLAGAEALVRWHHPEWGFQSPGDFIPLFERNGFITRLDQYVWEQTCATLRAWDDQGFPPIAISVNVSRADIYNADLEDILLKLLKKYGLEPDRLHLEITESAYTETPRQIIDMVSNLRKKGFVIEMDDFGSGYSSLNMLNEMPIDILKLDMKFIQSETAKQVSQGILQFIINLAQWMNLKVVAEGVETKEQLERLREIGCDYVQGYYFARPMPIVQFNELMVQQADQIEVFPLKGRKPSHPQHLLVADEDERYRRQVREVFEEKFEVLEASTGSAALACVERYGSSMAGMIISMTMEEPTGVEVLEHLRREHGTWDIPLIATGPLGAETEALALELGVDDFAGKPHRLSSLQKRLQHILRIRILRNREKGLLQAAYQDYLTGLLNCRGMDAELETLRAGDGPLAVYLLGLDDRKTLNDCCGYREGDQLLVQFAGILRNHARESDILVRPGGDKFIIIMRCMRDPEAALKKGELICRAARESLEREKSGGSCSGGVALWQMDIPFQEALEQAERALCRAKVENKGGCCLWENE